MELLPQPLGYQKVNCKGQFVVLSSFTALLNSVGDAYTEVGKTIFNKLSSYLQRISEHKTDKMLNHAFDQSPKTKDPSPPIRRISSLECPSLCRALDNEIHQDSGQLH